MPNKAHSLSTRLAQTAPHGLPKPRILTAFTGGMVVIAMLLLGSAAQAAGPQQAQTRHEADRAVCQKNNPNQDYQACLKEADAAFQASQKSGSIESSGPHTAQDLDRNRTLRCEPLPKPEREECLLRMQGEGSVEGSVMEGGVLRTLKSPVAPHPAQ